MTVKDNYLRQSNQRALLQFGGARCANPLTFAGFVRDFWITGATRQKQPTSTPEFFHDSKTPRKFSRDGVTVAAQAPDVFTLNAMRNCGGIPPILAKPNCRVTAYRISGKCEDLCDLCNTNWDSLEIFSGGIVTGPQTFTDGTNTTDTPLIDTIPFTAITYFVSRLAFSVITDTQIPDLATDAVVDLTFYGRENCSNCDQDFVGTEWVAKILQINGDGLLYFSTDSQKNWTLTTLEYDVLIGAGVATDYNSRSVDRIGNFLMVTFFGGGALDGGYVLLPIQSDGTLGTPVAIQSLGTGVAEAPTDVWVSGNTAYWSRTDGAILRNRKITQAADIEVILPPATITDVVLQRIHGCGNTIVSVGNELGAGSIPNGIVFSKDGGTSFFAATNPPGWGVAGFGIAGLFVRSPDEWDITTDDARIFRTCDCGLSWTQTYINSAGNIISDVIYATDEVGYALISNAQDLVRIGITLDGGVEWCDVETSTRVINLTDQDYNPMISGGTHPIFFAGRMAFPFVDDLDVRANNLITGGLGADSAEGWCQGGVPVFGEKAT